MTPEETYIQSAVRFLDTCDRFFAQCQAKGKDRSELVDFILEFTGDDSVRRVALDHLNMLWPEGK